MSDIAGLLRDAAEAPRELDLDRVRHEGRRRRRRPQKIGGVLVAAVVIVAGLALVVSRHDQDTKVIAPAATRPQPSLPTTTGPAATTTVSTPTVTTPAVTTATGTTPAVTTPAVTTPAGGVDRLSPASRLAFDGLGPVKLGMTPEEASQAAGTPIATGTNACNPTGVATADAIWPQSTGARFVLFGVADGRIVTVRVFDPSVSTLSGIHIGSTEADVLATYPGAAIGTGLQGNRAVRITDAQEHEIVFDEDTYDTPGTVGSIVLAMNRDIEDVGGC